MGREKSWWRSERVGKTAVIEILDPGKTKKHNTREQLLKTSTEFDEMKFLIWLQHLLSNDPNHPIACCRSVD